MRRPIRLGSLSVLAVVLAVLLWDGLGRAYWDVAAAGPIFFPRHLVCSDSSTQILDWRALGVRRGQAGLLAELQGAAAAYDYRRSIEIGDAIRAASHHHLTEAIPALRALASGPIPRGIEPYDESDRLHSKAQAAVALSGLGDRAAVPMILSLLTYLETHHREFFVEDLLGALAALDLAAAGRYARELLERQTELKAVQGDAGAGLPWLARAHEVRALPALRRLMADDNVPTNMAHSYCRVAAARLALDEPFRRQIRQQMQGSYSGSWAATCADTWLPAVLGDDPDDIPALLGHTGRDDDGTDLSVGVPAYERIVHLVGVLAQRGPGDQPRLAAARQKLLAQLRAESHRPVLSDPRAPGYNSTLTALHQVALAGLGERDALQWVLRRMTDSRDHSGETWLVAEHALELGLPGAVESAYGLLRQGGSYVNDTNTGRYEGLRLRVLDLVVRLSPPQDARWTVSLLDKDDRVRERALWHLSRLRPAGACHIVREDMGHLNDRQIQDGYFALHVLGDTCRSAFLLVAQSDKSQPDARGMALEMLGLLRDPVVAALAGRLKAVEDTRMAAGRALRLYENRP